MSETTALQRIEPMPVVAVAPTVEAMITLAIERGASVDTIERLMAVRREVRQEQAKEAFDRALAEFQEECPVIPKNKAVKNRDQTIRYRYADLEQIKATAGPCIRKHGFSYRFTTETANAEMITTCWITHIAGHSEPSKFAVPIENSGRMNRVQESGSSSTYAKRYALSNGLGIITSDEDNDGNTAELPLKPPAKDNGNAKSSAQPNTAARSPAARSEPGASVPPDPDTPATEEQRIRWIKQLQSIEKQAEAYGYAEGLLLPPAQDFPGEPISCWPLKATPSTKWAADKLFAKIKAFVPQGTPATSADQAQGAAGANVATKSAGSDDAHHSEDWYQFKMPFGKDKGRMLGELEKKTLFGWWANFEVETTYKGKPKKPETIANDERLREMLDDAGEFYQFEEPDNRD